MPLSTTPESGVSEPSRVSVKSWPRRVFEVILNALPVKVFAVLGVCYLLGWPVFEAATVGTISIFLAGIANLVLSRIALGLIYVGSSLMLGYIVYATQYAVSAASPPL